MGKQKFVNLKRSHQDSTRNSRSASAAAARGPVEIAARRGKGSLTLDYSKKARVASSESEPEYKVAFQSRRSLSSHKRASLLLPPPLKRRMDEAFYASSRPLRLERSPKKQDSSLLRLFYLFGSCSDEATSGGGLSSLFHFHSALRFSGRRRSFIDLRSQSKIATCQSAPLGRGSPRTSFFFKAFSCW